MSDVDNLVQDFITEPGVFFLGVKSLNYKSVAAARGRDHVLPVAGKHLYREIVESCLGGGRIDVSRTKLNYSLLPDSPMTGMVIYALVTGRFRPKPDCRPRQKRTLTCRLTSSPASSQGN